MPETETTFIPVVWMSKSDLLPFRPDLRAVLESLSESELDQLARQIGDALQPFSAAVIIEVLAHRFGDLSE